MNKSESKACFFFQRPAWELGRVFVAGFQFGEELGALLGRTGAAHDFASGEGLELAGGWGGVAIGKQVGGGQWLGVPQVSIQGVNQGSAFEHDPHTRVMMPVNSPLVSFGVAKPAFQVEIVLGHVGGISPREEPGPKAREHLGHLLSHPGAPGRNWPATDHARR